MGCRTGIRRETRSKWQITATYEVALRPSPSWKMFKDPPWIEYPLVSSNMACWKIPNYMNGVFELGKSQIMVPGFQHAMVQYRRLIPMEDGN